MIRLQNVGTEFPGGTVALQPTGVRLENGGFSVLIGSLSIMQYQDVSALLLIILLMVILVDAFSDTLRQRFKQVE